MRFLPVFAMAPTLLFGYTAASKISYRPPQDQYALYPHIAETSHASQPLVDLLYGYFTAKNLHEADLWLTYFDPIDGIYGDASLGELLPQPNLTSALRSFVALWGPDSRSYPLRIIGDTNSAIILMVDTPDMFGDELRVISSLDFKDSKVLRQVDYWDGRRNAVSASRVSDDQYPHNFGESVVHSKPHAVIHSIVERLSKALSQGNSTSAAELFAPDAVFEDFCTRARIEGRRAIGRYLNRTLSSLPYGVGSVVRHVVGSTQGGGYEWTESVGRTGRNGITAIELNSQGFITRLSSVWNALKSSDATMEALAKLSIET